MKNTDNHIDKVFREKLGDFRKQPPLDAWDGIKAGLRPGKRRSIMIPLWQAAAGAAIIITAGSIFYYLNQPGQPIIAEQPVSATEIVKPNNPGMIPESKVSAEVISSAPEFRPERRINSGGTKTLLATESSQLSEDSENVQFDDKQAQNNDSGNRQIINSNKGLWTENMPDAHIPAAQKDEIPRNKKTLTASWDMLTADNYEPSDENEAINRLSLMAQVSPTYSYRDIGNIITGSPGNFNEYESGKISYSGGIQFGFKTSQRLSIHTGIMYAQLGYNVNNVGSFYANKSNGSNDIITTPEISGTYYEVNNSIGTLSSKTDNTSFVESNSSRSKEYALFDNVQTNVNPTLNSTDGKLEQYFGYIEVPFLVRYRIVDQKIGINLLGGLSTNILVGNRASLSANNEVTDLGATENIRGFNYMGSMGLGFDYSITKSILFTVEPQFKYFLNSINREYLISNRPYMLGMFTGVRLVW